VSVDPVVNTTSSMGRLHTQCVLPSLSLSVRVRRNVRDKVCGIQAKACGWVAARRRLDVRIESGFVNDYRGAQVAISWRRMSRWAPGDF